MTIPDIQVCPHHATPWKAFSDAYFARNPVSVWKASRGFGGKSFLLALLGLVEAVTLKIDVNVLGGSGEQSERVHEHMSRFWDCANAPKSILVSDPIKRETKLVWGNQIQALMASQASVRGPHPTRLRLDEIDEMALDILDASLGQPMAKNGVQDQVVMSSTHQHANGTMTEIIRRAADKRWDYKEWCYRENLEPHGWLSQEQVERKKQQITAVMWATEYEGQEPAPDTRAIQPDSVAAMFDRTLGEFAGAPHENVELEPPVLVCRKCKTEFKDLDMLKCLTCDTVLESGQYATGADWARKKDWTVIITLRIDTKPARVVAFERLGREDWTSMIERFNLRLKRYRGTAAFDGTGLGDVVASYVQSDARGVMMVGKERANMLSEYIAAIDRKEIVSPWIRFMESEHRLASVEDVYSSGESHHLPDTIAAGALSWYAAIQCGLPSFRTLG